MPSGDRLDRSPSCKTLFIGYFTKFKEHVAVAYWLYLSNIWYSTNIYGDSELATRRCYPLKNLIYWSSDQFFVSFGQFSADYDVQIP